MKLLLLLLGVAASCVAGQLDPSLGPRVCEQRCETMPLHNFFNQTCKELCETTRSLLSADCNDALTAWGSSDKMTGASASVASANLVSWFEMIVEMAITISNTSNPAAAAQAESIVIKGYLKDFGKYDQCHELEGAHYCPTSVKSTALSMGGMSMGMVGMCMPQTCSAADVDALWQHMLSTLQIKADFSTGTTCGMQTVDWDTGSIVMLVLCALLAILVATATIVAGCRAPEEPRVEKKPDKLSSGEYAAMSGNTLSIGARILDCFSLFKNINKFGQIRSGTSTSCLDGVRTLSMCWVVMGHTLLWPFSADLPGYSNIGAIIPFYNKDALIGTFTGQAILSAEFSVDSFFFMSGFLATYIGIKKLSTRGTCQILKMSPLMYLDRFLRLTPVYFFIVMFYTYLSPMLSSGPFWSLLDQNGCKNSWWQNLLYIQTIFMSTGYEGNNSCYGVSWYLADDMMFFYCVPFIISLALWKREGAYVLMAIVSIASIITALIVAHKYKLSPSPFDPTGVLYMSKYYYPPWTRIPCYLIGTAFGIFWRDHQEKASRFLQDRKIQTAIWVASACVLGSCVWGNADQLQTVPSQLSQNRARAMAYVALAKPAWCVGLAAVCALCFARVGGYVQWFLEAPIFGYLSKLTFTVYLIHPTILYIWVRSITSPLHFSTVNYSMWFIAVLASSSAVAFVMHVCIEQPTSNMLAILFAPGARPAKKDPNAPDGDGLDQDGIELSDRGWMTLPLPFEGESSFRPALPSGFFKPMLALPAPTAGPSGQSAWYSSSTDANQLSAPLGGPDLENSALSQIA